MQAPQVPGAAARARWWQQGSFQCPSMAVPGCANWFAKSTVRRCSVLSQLLCNCSPLIHLPVLFQKASSGL